MQLINWFRYCVKERYADFTGRAGRTEYWWYQLAYLVLMAVVLDIEITLGVRYLGLIIGLGLLLPTLGVLVRRLHDTNKSGWWVLINFTPIMGWIVLVVFTLTEGDLHNNRYGKPPAQIYGR